MDMVQGRGVGSLRRGEGATDEARQEQWRPGHSRQPQIAADGCGCFFPDGAAAGKQTAAARRPRQEQREGGPTRIDACRGVVAVVERTRAPAWDRHGSLRRRIAGAVQAAVAASIAGSVAVPDERLLTRLSGDAQTGGRDVD